jgi:hypothetical protein
MYALKLSSALLPAAATQVSIVAVKATGGKAQNGDSLLSNIVKAICVIAIAYLSTRKNAL